MDGYFHAVARNAQTRANLRSGAKAVSVQTSHPPYCYKRLEHEDEIRLIKFVDFSSDKPIIELDHVHIDQNPHYRALSYTWGINLYTSRNWNEETKKQETHTAKDIILIRETDPVTKRSEFRHLAVTKNCSEAVWRLYADNPDDQVWIDAICIDQENIQERNHQIGLMEIVYRGATKVQVYTGTDDTEEHSVEAMIYLERNFRSILKGDKNLFENFAYADVLPRQTADAIAALLRRDWFYRVWVLQEVQSAKYAEIICGKYKVPWLALRCLVAPSFYNATFPTELPLILDIAEGGSRSKDLLTWLRNTRSLRATDPRDKVYAMLTLAYNVNHRTAEPPPEELFVICQMHAYQLLDWLLSLVKLNLISSDDILPVNIMAENISRILKVDYQRRKMVKTASQKAITYDIVPDYSSSISLIYSNVARRTINSSKNLNIFDDIIYNAESVVWSEVKTSKESCPSWAPDWSRWCQKVTLPQEAGIEFSACGEFKFECAEATVTPLELVARGKLLGRVEYINYSSPDGLGTSRRIGFYEQIRYRREDQREVFFEISQRATDTPNFSEGETSEIEDTAAIAFIIEWLVTVFSQVETLAVLRIILNVSLNEHARVLRGEQSSFQGPYRRWSKELEKGLERYRTSQEFNAADGGHLYRKIRGISWPSPEDFRDFDGWLAKFSEFYAEKLLEFKSNFNEERQEKLEHTHLLHRLDRETANITEQLPQFYPARNSVWLQKRDVSEDEDPQKGYLTYAIVDDKLFGFDDMAATGLFSRPFSFSRSRFTGAPLRAVVEIEPALESQLRFLKDVLNDTILWINKLREFPGRLRNGGFDPKLSTDRVLFIAGDYRGLGPKVMECGDVVCILLGGRTPFVLRPTGGRLSTEPPSSQTPFPSLVDVKYSFIGECYVEGVMHGEGVKGTKDPDSEFEWFTLQ